MKLNDLFYTGSAQLDFFWTEYDKLEYFRLDHPSYVLSLPGSSELGPFLASLSWAAFAQAVLSSLPSSVT